MKKTFYFSHDYNTRTDEKIRSMMRKLGVEGYGLYWILIEDLYNNAEALQLDYDGIAYDYRIDEKIVKSLIEDFELFIIEGDKFYSKGVLERLEEINNKSAKARENAMKRWNNKNATVMQSHSNRNAIKENKIKENKINKNIISKDITTKVETFGNQNINNMQDFIKTKVEDLGYIYKPGKQERNRIKNIISAKVINGLAEKYKMTIDEFVGNIILLSSKLDFRNGKITNAETFYKYYDKILNESLKIKQKQDDEIIDYGLI